MRIAVLADIHGNVPAMEAVLADLRERPVDEVLVGGDLVGRGPQGSRVARRIRELGWPGVRGNHEDYLISFRRREVPDAWLTAEEWSAARFMAADLDADDERYLAALPMRIDSALAPVVTVVHGTPQSHGEGLGPWTDDAELCRHLDTVDGGVLVCGHTHRSMVRQVDSGVVVNAGAVGLPFNGDTRAQYAVIDTGAPEARVELRRVAYDVEETVEIYRTSGFLDRGGATARLLLLELQRARPLLVPFLKWIAETGRSHHVDQVDRFLSYRDGD